MGAGIGLLAAPLAGAAVLALVGHRRHAAALNVAFSLLTLVAAACGKTHGQSDENRYVHSHIELQIDGRQG